MADKTYLYQPTGATKEDIEVLVNTAAGTLAVAVPSGVLILPVTIDELYKQDLDDAMLDLGYGPVGEATDPNPGSTTNWGSQPNEPTGPLPFSPGDIYYNTTEEAYYYWDDTAMEWKPYGANVGPGTGSLVVTLSSQADAWIEGNSPTYQVLSKFRFAGTDKLGTAIKIYVNAWKESGNVNNWVAVRIFDITNGNAIAELTNINQGDAAATSNPSIRNQLLDLGALSSLPTGAALFEIQGRRAGGGATVAIATVNVEF